MKFLYVVVSDNTDYYYEQAFLSIITLRKFNPSAFITLLTDTYTEKTFEIRKANINSLVNELIVEKFENEVNKIVRSRLLKTNMRNLIDGDFLYIDSDTVITASLDYIWNKPIDFGAVGDGNINEIDEIIERNHFHKGTKRLRKTIKDKTFREYKTLFNSGVLFVRDTKLNREFFGNWVEEWNEYAKKGYFNDQFPLQIVNWKKGFPIKLMENELNLQNIYGVVYLNKCKIFHYFANSRVCPEIFDILHKIKTNGTPNESEVNYVLNLENFYKKPSILISGQNFYFHLSNINMRIFIVKFSKIFPRLFKFLDKILGYIIYFKINLRRKI